jgi:protein TonB
LNDFALRSDLNLSPAALALVIFVHVVAALLFAQLLKATRYVQPEPLTVSLLREPAQPQPDVAPVPLPQAPAPVREVKREPLPEPVKPEPVREVRHEPRPVERVVLPEPEPAPQRAVEVPPPPPPQSITEVPVPPPPVPVVVAAPAPAPMPITQPPAVVQAPEEPEEITMTSQMLTAVYLRNPKPSYPSLSRRMSEQGTVLLRVFVNAVGDATRVDLKESSGFPRLDKAALDAVEGWKFVPAKKGDHAIAAWVVVPIKFSLKG